ncbi:hypothetical protein ACNQVK_01860 [Mycobacterium sp. 134]|uniref:hypothetical protein n=1 Tax=Mycobacterium sp. 134 TaxID=3400425 RepID=UPI003AB09A30
MAVGLIAGGVMAFGGGGGEDEPPTGKAADVVTAYLEALQRGDAKAALSLGREQPPDSSILTDEVLKKQMEKYPITDVRILGEIPVSDGGAFVRLLAKVGGVENDGGIYLPKPPPGDGWKLKSAVTSVEVLLDDVNPKLAQYITVWGQPLPKGGKAYQFPGATEFGSSNPTLQIEELRKKHGQETVPSLFGITAMSSSLALDFSLSDKGTEALKQAVTKALQECAKSTSLQPPNCPNTATRSDFVPDSAQWTAPPNVDDFTLNLLDHKTGKVKFSGRPEFGVSVKTTSGQTESGSFAPGVEGTADMTTDPPTIELNKV